MQLNAPDLYRTASEIDAVADLLDIHGARVLELGCGAAHTTRALVERLGAAAVVATEVDRVQHTKNLHIADLPAVRFVLGGAEAIDAPDASFDAVFMFKSLHHVPVTGMERALGEIQRVLKPGGAALFSEPVYWGPFNELMSLIHDEREVRQAAFDALRRAVDAGLFRSEAEVFIEVPGSYPDWESFAGRFLEVTHTQLDVDAARRAQIRAAFEAHLTPDGAHFMKPHRLDLLRKPAGD
ncbi:MAG: class I SAM-dependent methyltransferase [Thiohalocapsa sp.]|jgi:SAM-dependent methyltransferase|uniref:class I SAM-dependent methyltransferase n=1 Tax=Thiohalocapsa sp. TaxID=2497641 RepID=UPI0025FB8E7E|nr:class I SAM-dependent methyltransferase [Thiohalocapsa sp.]MCG6941285.1 class I SAM-dependent methyltransferase [Thiohalocapsa sp.]